MSYLISQKASALLIMRWLLLAVFLYVDLIPMGLLENEPNFVFFDGRTTISSSSVGKSGRLCPQGSNP